MFLNTVRKNDVDAQVEFSSKFTKRARVTCYDVELYDRVMDALGSFKSTQEVGYASSNSNTRLVFSKLPVYIHC